MKKKKLSLLATFVLILGLWCSTANATAFYDVSDDFWAAPYISNLESRGIISGYGDGYFLPENYVQRCEYAKMLVNASGTPLSTNRTSPYADIDVNEWYFPYINSITAQMPGYQSSTPSDTRIYFKPFDNATREDVTVALMRVMNYDLSEYYPVSDDLLSDVFYDYASIPKQDRPYIAEAVKRGYITGTQEGTFLGSDPITRCEVSAVLFRAFPEENLSLYTQPEGPDDKTSGLSALTVHFLDVGQGDSELIILPDGRIMLIDAGTAEYGSTICEYIRNLGYNKIDYIVATHPHADHIGGMTDIINSFEIGAFYLPRASTNTKTYERLLAALLDRGINTIEASAGVSVVDEGGLSADFIAPCGTDYSDLNNYSVVLRLRFGHTAFLFMGDAEKLSENEIISAFRQDLHADVIKLGHHGSSSSSGAEFLSLVQPSYAVISCGRDNSYGHPHAETLETLAAMNITALRTDTEGTIIITSNGEEIEIN